MTIFSAYPQEKLIFACLDNDFLCISLGQVYICSSEMRYCRPPEVTKSWKNIGFIAILIYLGAPEWDMFDRQKS